MVRGWIILSSLVLSTLFRLFDKIGKTDWPVVHFPFSDRTLNFESYIYFLMEHLIAIAIAGCLLIQDSTPRLLLWVFFGILCLDMLHYILFFRDEGIGFNLAKVIVFIIAIIWSQRNYLKR